MTKAQEKQEKWLYPPIEPYDTGMLKVSPLHTIYYEQCGNPKGLPALFLHGGPGEGFEPRDRRYFDPAAYRIVMFDQRGVGKSTPAFCLEENDTWALLGDIEKLREHLGVDKWVVFGGSWGSTLALLYAETHVDLVLAVVVNGVFLCRQADIDWFNEGGASNLFPDVWETYSNAIPPEERGNFLQAYHKRFVGPGVDEAERRRCVQAWMVYETATCELYVPREELEKACKDVGEEALGYCRVESHYLVNGAFLPTPDYILEQAHVLAEARTPVSIVQGRYDVVCPATAAWDLKKCLPHADLKFIWNAGHEAKESANTKEIVAALDKYRKLSHHFN